MKYVRVAIIVASIGLCATQAAPAGSQPLDDAAPTTRDDIRDCNNAYTHENMERTITACTNLFGVLPKYAADGLYLNRGVAHMDAKQFDEALADFNAALELSPNDIGMLHERGNLYEEIGKFDDAIADANLALEVQPNSALSLSDRCRSRAEADKDLDAALDDCNRALDLDPSDHPGWRALVYLRMGKYPEALADYDVAIRMYPKSHYFWFGRGIVKLRMGDTVGGNSDIAAAEAIRPDVKAIFVLYGITSQNGE